MTASLIWCKISSEILWFLTGSNICFSARKKKVEWTYFSDNHSSSSSCCPTNLPTQRIALASRANLPGSAPHRACYAALQEAPLAAGGLQAFREGLSATSCTSRESDSCRER